MYSYSIYTGISHVNQFIRLHPALIRQITEELDQTAARYGGRSSRNGEYQFPSSVGESARKTAEAAAAMHRIFRDNSKALLGATVLIARIDPGEENNGSSFPDSLLFQVSDEDGLWVDMDVFDDFRDYFEGETDGRLFRVRSLKELGPRLEDRLPSLLVRPDRLRVLRQSLESMERDEKGRTVLLLRGRAGSGKRQTLKVALRQLYPDDSGSPLTLFFSERSEDPLEPFVRALGPSLASVPENLDDEETLWWENEAAGFLETCRSSGAWISSRDQAPLDLVQAFALYMKAHVQRCRKAGRPAYLIVDGFTPESDSLRWLRSLLNEFHGVEGFRLIIIRDSDDFDEPLPVPGKGHELAFRRPSSVEWDTLIANSCRGNEPEAQEKEKLAEFCGSNLYRLFHSLLARERNLAHGADPAEALVESLDSESRRLLFLAYAADGLADRDSLVSRFGDDEDAIFQEATRYDGLMGFGLIREDPDGRVHIVPGGPKEVERQDLERIRDAEAFGEALYRRLEEGKAVDLFRLYRYLETWGPGSRAIAVLNLLLDKLLTNRRLRTAGQLLNGPLMSGVDLRGRDMEAFQNVIGAARLRYMLLTGTLDDARALVRDGIVSVVSAQGAYSDRFRLQSARYSYALGRYEDALSASKDALFSFQKSGDHQGETHSHVELALSLLAAGKVRDALEHFGIARRIGIQVSASWGVLRASVLETVTQYLFGNLSRAERDGREYRMLAQREGRRDLWLLLTLLLVRILYDLGSYSAAEKLASEGQERARFYGFTNEERVLRNWRARAMANGRQKSTGIALLESHAERGDGRDPDREAAAFLAEIFYHEGNRKSARRYVDLAAACERKAVRLQGEVDDWSDGFFPIEGRLTDARGEPVDALGEWIESFQAFLNAKDGNHNGVARLSSILENDKPRMPKPFSYHYNLWLALVTPNSESEQQTRCISRAFNALQARAGRFDDNQAKHAWLSENPWNRLLMEEAQRRKFL